MPNQRTVPVNLPNAVERNPPLLSVGIHELEHPLLAFRKVDDPERDPLYVSVEPVQVSQLEDALAEPGIMPDTGSDGCAPRQVYSRPTVSLKDLGRQPL
jgi:hypothetical protein